MFSKQPLTSHCEIIALDVGVLLGLNRLDMIEADAEFFSPHLQGPTDIFWAVVDTYGLRPNAKDLTPRTRRKVGRSLRHWSLAEILDLHSRQVIGWAVSNCMKRDLTIRALKMTIAFRQPPKGYNHHTDRHSRYIALRYPDSQLDS